MNIYYRNSIVFDYSNIKMSIPNKGTGAGGANTNVNGLKFEDKTDNIPTLVRNGFIKHCIYPEPTHVNHFCWIKVLADRRIVFLKQEGLRPYMKHAYDVDIFRKPDEAYIIEYDNGDVILIIIEKKTQSTSGSVDEKLYAGLLIRDEYEYILKNADEQYMMHIVRDELNKIKFKVVYAFCINDYLRNRILARKGLRKNVLDNRNIPVFYGDEPDYFTNFNKWLGKWFNSS